MIARHGIPPLIFLGAATASGIRISCWLIVDTAVAMKKKKLDGLMDVTHENRIYVNFEYYEL